MRWWTILIALAGDLSGTNQALIRQNGDRDTGAMTQLRNGSLWGLGGDLD